MTAIHARRAGLAEAGESAEGGEAAALIGFPGGVLERDGLRRVQTFEHLFI
ncbi:hypothetical protein K788_00000110 [Paraburkholderia caribensis MBA4]|uniref:Uncharacterized protein n=1 Tax=Paraburkholderia caribensis MBA4 TaxID=1323664 RepID=A0A0P0RJK3_9BURK|nr:hypothetical protein K788_00000110 [Paraburkholderia caribensis MBA4]